jgi:hypothetical protein
MRKPVYLNDYMHVVRLVNNETVAYCASEIHAETICAALNAYTEPPDEPQPDATPNNVPFAGE